MNDKQQKHDPVLAAHEVAVAMANFAEVIAPVLEAVNGHRMYMRAQGYADGQARRMAADYHHLLVTAMAQQNAEGSP